MKILEKEEARRPADDATPGVNKQPGRVGRSSVENPQTLAGMSEFKRKLLELGAPAPGETAPTSTAATVPMPHPAAETEEPDADTEDFQAKIERLLPA